MLRSGPSIGHAVKGEEFTDVNGGRYGEQLLLLGLVPFGCLNQCRQFRQPLADALMDSCRCCALDLGLSSLVSRPDRRRRSPLCPARILQRPLLDIEVEPSNPSHHTRRSPARLAIGFEADAVAPRLRDVNRQMQRVSSRVMPFDQPKTGSQDGRPG